MTVEEIKQNTTMRDVLKRYGIRVRGNVCCCPIHGEKHPSMQIFDDGYKCHACQSYGDIFSFVQAMEGCDFKTAYLMLGGEYKRKNKTARANLNKSIERRKTIQMQAEEDEKRFKAYLMGAIALCDYWIAFREPFSDDWCYAQNVQQWLWNVYETKYIEGEEVDEVNVFRKCRKVRQRFVTV